MMKMQKTALICGISGQDGTLLASLLLSKGYIVYGTSRDSQANQFSKLVKLGIKEHVILMSMSPEDFRSVFVTLNKCQPDEIYFLAGQSSVGLSFELPAETIQSITLGTLNLLEACRIINKNIKLYNAGSSEVFGDTKGEAANEKTKFSPKSPYAVAKASSFWLVDNYRESYDLFACTGILFNHESYIRPRRFVTRKIIDTVKKIQCGEVDQLVLGRIDISRDWGLASEYVEAMWLMLQQDKPEDYVIATGKSYMLSEFIERCFAIAGLDMQKYLVSSPSFFRPSEILVSCADPSKSFSQLGWKAKTDMNGVVENMMEYI